MVHGCRRVLIWSITTRCQWFMVMIHNGWDWLIMLWYGLMIMVDSVYKWLTMLNCLKSCLIIDEYRMSWLRVPEKTPFRRRIDTFFCWLFRGFISPGHFSGKPRKLIYKDFLIWRRKQFAFQSWKQRSVCMIVMNMNKDNWGLWLNECCGISIYPARPWIRLQRQRQFQGQYYPSRSKQQKQFSIDQLVASSSTCDDQGVEWFNKTR